MDCSARSWGRHEVSLWVAGSHFVSGVAFGKIDVMLVRHAAPSAGARGLEGGWGPARTGSGAAEAPWGSRGEAEEG